MRGRASINKTIRLRVKLTCRASLIVVHLASSLPTNSISLSHPHGERLRYTAQRHPHESCAYEGQEINPRSTKPETIRASWSTILSTYRSVSLDIEETLNVQKGPSTTKGHRPLGARSLCAVREHGIEPKTPLTDVFNVLCRFCNR